MPPLSTVISRPWGWTSHPEEPTNKGRMDLTLRFEDRTYLIEFKVVELTDQSRAIEQIKARGGMRKSFKVRRSISLGWRFPAKSAILWGLSGRRRKCLKLISELKCLNEEVPKVCK